MKIFGGLLPFIGFRKDDIPAELAKAFGYPPGTTRIDTFQVEWLGYAVCLPYRPLVPPND